MPKGAEGREADAGVDDLDRRIIACLQESPRRSNTEVAGLLGLSESTVRRRIRRLLSDDYLRFAAIADPLRIGYPVVAILGIRCAPHALTEVEAALERLPEFRFIGQTTGPYDYIAEAWFSSFDELRIFLTQKLAGIPTIQRVETNQVMKMVKYVYDWGRPNPDTMGLPIDGLGTARAAD